MSAPLPALRSDESPAGEWYPTVKRGMDVVGAAMLLVLLAPVLALIAVAVRASSPGPALFVQPRWGYRERQFAFLKFRTMHVSGAEASVGENGSLLKRADDPRITSVGRILRATSLDELPQLWNVLRGDMSLVGPRPLMIHMLEPYPELRRARCALRPGLTGLWQVSARQHNTHAHDMAEWDLRYLRECSFALDVSILARTPSAVFSRRGAI